MSPPEELANHSRANAVVPFTVALRRFRKTIGTM
jgi:hypothetical protein